MPALTVTSTDPILHVVAPVSLAAAAGTALVVDRDPMAGWPFRVGRLSELVAAGPTADDLHPTRPGVALLGGPVDHDAAVDDLVGALRASWPAVVIRVPAGSNHDLCINPALPWQPASDVTVGVGLWRRPEATIPTPPVRVLRRILRGHIDPRWRWFRHWRQVWDRDS